MSPTLAVLGAINVDLVVRVATLPAPGVTVTDGTFSRHHGGKGGNQAVAAARAFGAAGRVAMLGCVGDDDLGREAVRALVDEGVDVSAVAVSAEAPSGVALIAVDEAGENQIAVAPGANLGLDAGKVRDALERLRPGLLLVSLEAAEEATHAAASWARDGGVALLLNPAPVQPWVRELLAVATWVTPNEHELAALGPLPGHVGVIETRGAQGAFVRAPGAAEVHVQAPPVEAVDATGAGDCFNGWLAVGLLEGLAPVDATQRAVAAASASIAVPGAREGMPSRNALPT